MAEETKKTVKKAPAKKTTKKTAPKAETPVEEAAAPKAKKTTKKAAPKAAAPKAEKPVEAKVEAKAEPKAAPKAEKPVEVKAPVTEATAFARDVRITPRKVRLVADIVRGKDVKDALGILAITNKVAVAPIVKIIKSASANAVNNFGMDASKLYIAEIQVNDGLKIKRFIPRAKGSASGIVKRNANIRITVKERN